MEKNTPTKDKENFSLIARLRSTNHAWRGLGIMFKTTHNAWVHLFFAVAVIVLGYILCISATEWLFVVLAIGFVFVTEAINTAIEIDIDLTSPEYHPYARDTKDVAAGAVLLATLFAAIVGLVIFLPKLAVLI
ncbi:MAG TPA: diacylglycerol kinase family protein [Candidatus Paceibacterota bacterium]